MKIPFVDLAARHAPIRDELARVISQVIESGELSGGRFVEEFESGFAEYCGTDFAVGVGSGTDALWLVLLAMGLGPGDEVITVPNGFIATAEAIARTGATPVFVDVEEGSLNMDPGKLERAVTQRTKAIVPVHLFGQTADMDPILEVAERRGLKVIEDAAQAHGARYKGRTAGSLGDAACFSFYPTKNLGALGESGAITTSDIRLRDRLRMLRNHGQREKYQHELIGWNSRMDGIHAAVLSLKLSDLELQNGRRRELASEYDSAFAGVSGVVCPAPAARFHHVFHLYAVRLRERASVTRCLEEAGIGFGIHYPVPIHRQAPFLGLGYHGNSFPVTARSCRELVSLPMHPGLHVSDVRQIAATVKQAVRDCVAA